MSADCASSVALVVNELVQNGVGFQADRPRPGGAGLELASTIVREKLTGEWSVESGPGGTRISFDFLEQ